MENIYLQVTSKNGLWLIGIITHKAIKWRCYRVVDFPSRQHVIDHILSHLPSVIKKQNGSSHNQENKNCTEDRKIIGHCLPLRLRVCWSGWLFERGQEVSCLSHRSHPFVFLKQNQNDRLCNASQFGYLGLPHS